MDWIEPLHMVTVVGVTVGAVGSAFTVTVNVFPVPEHPVEFCTLSVPVYVAAAAPDGTVILIWLDGSVAVVTLEKPAVKAALFHTMLYVVGEPEVAE
jgi:hypothetical protein